MPSGVRRQVSGVFGHDATEASMLQKMTPAATSRGVAEDGGAWASLASPSPTASEPTNDYLSVTPSLPDPRGRIGSLMSVVRAFSVMLCQ